MRRLVAQRKRVSKWAKHQVEFWRTRGAAPVSSSAKLERPSVWFAQRSVPRRDTCLETADSVRLSFSSSCTPSGRSCHELATVCPTGRRDNQLDCSLVEPRASAPVLRPSKGFSAPDFPPGESDVLRACAVGAGRRNGAARARRAEPSRDDALSSPARSAAPVRMCRPVRVLVGESSFSCAQRVGRLQVSAAQSCVGRPLVFTSAAAYVSRGPGRVSSQALR